jgi:hypothetical protein
MQHGASPTRQHLPPWYLWPLALFAFVAALTVMLPLGVIALVSIPLTWLYPDRHMHIADVQGTAEEKARLARWRAAHNRLSFVGRVRHSIRRSVRQRRRAA